MGIKTYFQENGRIFPESNSAKSVRKTVLEKIRQASIIEEEVESVQKLDEGFALKTKKSKYYFTHIIFATGGHSGYRILENLGVDLNKCRSNIIKMLGEGGMALVYEAFDMIIKKNVAVFLAIMMIHLS